MIDPTRFRAVNLCSEQQYDKMGIASERSLAGELRSEGHDGDFEMRTTRRCVMGAKGMKAGGGDRRGTHTQIAQEQTKRGAQTRRAEAEDERGTIEEKRKNGSRKLQRLYVCSRARVVVHNQSVSEMSPLFYRGRKRNALRLGCGAIQVVLRTRSRTS